MTEGAISVDSAAAGIKDKSAMRVVLGSAPKNPEPGTLYIDNKSQLTVSDNNDGLWTIDSAAIGSYGPLSLDTKIKVPMMNNFDNILFEAMKSKFEPFIRNGVGGPLYQKLLEILKAKFPDMLTCQITRNEGEAIISLRKAIDGTFPTLATIEHNLVIWHMPGGLVTTRITFVEHECDLHKVVKAIELLVNYYNELEARETKLTHQFDVLDTQENK